MVDLLDCDEIRQKMKKLSPSMRRAFIHAMERLYERECDTFINMLEQSRDDIAETAEVIEEEQMALRSESRMFERERTDMSYYNERQGMSSRASSRASCATPRDPHERPDSSIHSHRRRHRKPVNKLLMRPSSEGSHAYRKRIESPGATSTRSLPTPIVTRTIEEVRQRMRKELNNTTTLVVIDMVHGIPDDAETHDDIKARQGFLQFLSGQLSVHHAINGYSINSLLTPVNDDLQTILTQNVFNLS